MNIIQLHIYKWVCLFIAVLVLSACSHPIKQDLIALDQAIYESGMDESKVAHLTDPSHETTDLASQLQLVQQLHATFESYNRAIGALDFQSDEVRVLRDELSDHNHQMLTALSDILALNLRSDVGLSHNQLQHVTATLQRSEKQLMDGDAKIQATIQKIKALGEDNGVYWQ